MSMSHPEKIAVAVAVTERWAGEMPGERLFGRVAHVTGLNPDRAKAAVSSAESIIGAMGFGSMSLAATWFRESAQWTDWTPSASFTEWLGSVVARLGSTGSAADLARAIEGVRVRVGGGAPSRVSATMVVVDSEQLEVTAVAMTDLALAPEPSPVEEIAAVQSAPLEVVDDDPLRVADARDELDSLPFDTDIDADTDLSGDSESDDPFSEPIVGSLDQYFDDDDSVDLDGPEDEE
jgi:hypothetical protein